MTSNEWTQLEQAVMRLLLAGDDASLLLLRRQFERASLQSREMTGVGLYTYFTVPDDLPRLPSDLSVAFGDVEATMPTLMYKAGFLLWISAGAIAFLEGYTYCEPWPEDTSGFSLAYISEQRDISMLHT
ncbi:MAG TPA: hypothetical protein PK794_01265 [Armatimonadota bacterium]|nr:hypothetical protein [Armatimonadota bacterium]